MLQKAIMLYSISCVCFFNSIGCMHKTHNYWILYFLILITGSIQKLDFGIYIYMEEKSDMICSSDMMNNVPRGGQDSFIYQAYINDPRSANEYCSTPPVSDPICIIERNNSLNSNLQCFQRHEIRIMMYTYTFG